MHVVGVNVCRGDGQAPLPTGRLLYIYTERQQRKMGVRSGSLRRWRSASALPSQVMRGRILCRFLDAGKNEALGTLS